MNKDGGTHATLTSLQRQPELKAAAVMARTTLSVFADQCCASYNHFSLVVNGERVGSIALEERIATLLDRPRAFVFPTRTHVVLQVLS